MTDLSYERCAHDQTVHMTAAYDRTLCIHSVRSCAKNKRPVLVASYFHDMAVELGRPCASSRRADKVLWFLLSDRSGHVEF